MSFATAPREWCFQIIHIFHTSIFTWALINWPKKPMNWYKLNTIQRDAYLVSIPPRQEVECLYSSRIKSTSKKSGLVLNIAVIGVLTCYLDLKSNRRFKKTYSFCALFRSQLPWRNDEKLKNLIINKVCVTLVLYIIQPPRVLLIIICDVGNPTQYACASWYAFQKKGNKLNSHTRRYTNCINWPCINKAMKYWKFAPTL